MLSKGKKIEWLCPKCRSPRISPLTMHGQLSGACTKCNTYWPWRTRIKQRASNDFLQTRPAADAGESGAVSGASD